MCDREPTVDTPKTGFRKTCSGSDGARNLVDHRTVIEYLGSEQFIYVDVGVNENFVIVKEKPDLKVPLNKKLGLKISQKDIHFFSKNDYRLNQ